MTWKLSFKAGNDTIRAYFDDTYCVVTRNERYWYSPDLDKVYRPSDVTQEAATLFAWQCNVPISDMKTEVVF